MERDRIAAGGAIDTADPANPITVDFNKLHNRSEFVEEAILCSAATRTVAGGNQRARSAASALVRSISAAKACF